MSSRKELDETIRKLIYYSCIDLKETLDRMTELSKERNSAVPEGLRELEVKALKNRECNTILYIAKLKNLLNPSKN